MPSNDDLNFGETLRGLSPGMMVFGGRYELIRKLGRGGMGEVWLVKDLSLELEVALKFLPELLSSDAKAVADLKRETRRSLKLTHPNIVRIYDFCEDDRFAAISMEYVDGKTLSELSIEKPDHFFEWEDIEGWVKQLCAALHYAHTEAKIVHRDLKPANLMVDGRGNLKVADFGVSASITDSASRVSVHASSSGTPVYMSPQQIMGDPPSISDDAYSFGATLYELLTSRPPFYTGNVLLQVQSKVPPSIVERRRELYGTSDVVSSVVEELVAACLSKEVISRPQDVKQLLDLISPNSTDVSQANGDTHQSTDYFREEASPASEKSIAEQVEENDGLLSQVEASSETPGTGELKSDNLGETEPSKDPIPYDDNESKSPHPHSGWSKRFVKIIFAVVVVIGLYLGLKYSFESSEPAAPPRLLAHMETNHGTVVMELFEDKAPITVANFVGLAEGSKLWKTSGGVEKKEPFYVGLTFHRVIKDFMIQGGCPLGNGTGGPGYTFQDETYLGKMVPVEGEIVDEKIASEVFNQVLLPHLKENQGKSPIPAIAELFAAMNSQRSFNPMFGMTVEHVQDLLKHTGPILAFAPELDAETGEPILIAGVDYGTLCMANSGPNTNGSQFFIVTKKGGASWLDGKHTVFGQVVEGMEVILAIQEVETDPQDKPVEEVEILSIRIERA